MVFTLAEKLAEAEGKDASRYLLPSLKAEVNHFQGTPAIVPAGTDSKFHASAYPMMGLGGRSDIGEPGAPPPVPVCGPSMPKCGTRPTDPVANPFVGLSLEMADYNYKRTQAIMKGARPGC